MYLNLERECDKSARKGTESRWLSQIITQCHRGQDAPKWKAVSPTDGEVLCNQNISIRLECSARFIAPPRQRGVFRSFTKHHLYDSSGPGEHVIQKITKRSFWLNGPIFGVTIIMSLVLMRPHTGMFRDFVAMAGFKLALAHAFLEMGLRGPCKFEIYAILLSPATSGASLRIAQHSVDAKTLSWPQGVAERWCHPFMLGLLGMEGVNLSKRFHFQ